jgi:hypothetical protein
MRKAIDVVQQLDSEHLHDKLAAEKDMEDEF